MAVVTRLELKGRNGLDKFDKYPIAVNIPVSLNYNLADVRNPDQRKASFSKTINLNGTNEINKLFENIFSVNVATQYFNKNLKTPVRYIVNEIENFSGDLQLIKININPDNSIVYECSIIGAGGSLFVDIGEKYITGNAQVTATSGLLVVGRYYTITDFIAGDNFTNVASVYSGTINTDGCVFLATGTTPTTWTNLSILTSNEDLDFRIYNHNYTRALQIASRTTYLGTGAGYVYPLIDRGTNGGSDIIWNVKDFLPCFSIYEYISKIISATGRTFTSTFLNTAEFKKLYCYSNVTKIELSQAQLQNQQFYVGLINNVTQIGISGAVTTLVHDNEAAPFFDNGLQNNTTTGFVTINESGYYNIASKVLYRIKFTHPDTNVASMSLSTSAGIYNGITRQTPLSDIVFNNATFDGLGGMPIIPINTFVTTPINEVATGEMFFSAGDVIYNRARVLNIIAAGTEKFYNSAGTIITPTGNPTFTIEALSGINGCSFYGLVTKKEVVEGNPLLANNSLPTKIKQKDFFKSIVQAFNLYVDVDKDNENNLIIETFDEFYDADIVDYENKTDLAKEQSINPNLLEGKRYIYAYKSDADYYNDLYQKTWNETYGTQQIDVENDFIKSDKKNELIFSATPNVGNYGMGIAHPRIYQLDGTNKKTIAANIRMLYCAVKTSPNAYTYKQIGQTDLVTNDYLYAGMEDDPFNPTYSLAFDFPKEVYYNYVQAQFTNNNLYNRYHKNYLKNLIDKDAKFVTKYLWLNEKDIYLFNFRNRLFIDGAYYIVNKIENYNPLELTSTKVELVKLLDADVFTPTSVLISEDTGINAGQDIQNYRLNSSLNVGTNIQNRGANCLAVGNNIVIPASCENLIVFGSNITADENSTGLLLNYKSYVALITQVGTGAPTVFILENTIGDIVWTRLATGDYRGTLTDAFTDRKVITLSNQMESLKTILIQRKNIDAISIETFTTSTGAAIDSVLNRTSIEIRVYN
jgi:hypothetical protein